MIRLIPFLLSALLMAQESSEARLHRWKADLHAFAARLETEHPRPFARLSKEAFEARLSGLEAALPSLKDPDVAARWADLLGQLGEEHTGVDFTAELGALRLPIQILSTSDGPRIVKATRPYRHLLGARLERVEGVSIAGVYAALKPYVPHTHEGWYRHEFDDGFDAWPLLMDAAGVVKVKPCWVVEGTTLEGASFSEEVPLLDAEAMKHQAWEEEGFPAGRPLRHQFPGTSSFYRFLPKSKALYFRLRSCDPDPNRPLRPQLRRALAEHWRRGGTRIVVDIRGNTGGKESLVDALIQELGRLPRKVRRFALIDGAVFSSGAVAAWRLKHEIGATLVGEACGASANHIGNLETFTLPSGREARFGTEIHIIDPENPEDFSGPILPDFPRSLSYADGSSGRDPVLEAALSMPCP